MKKEVEHTLAAIHEIIENKLSNLSRPEEKRGLLLYYYSLYRVFGKAEYAQKYKQLINQLVSVMPTSTQPNANAVKHSAELGYILTMLDEEDFANAGVAAKLQQLDTYLYESAITLAAELTRNNVLTLFAIIHYFNRRTAASPRKRYLPEILERSYPWLTKDYIGVRFAHYYTQPDDQAASRFGLVNGLSGKLLILVNTYLSGLQNEALQAIIRDGIVYMLTFRGNVDFSERRYAMFPAKVNGKWKGATFSNRLAWSGSDLNQALLLYRVSEMLRDKELKKLGDLVGLHTLMRRDEPATGVVDATFMRGSSGVAQMYRTLYAHSHNKAYWEGYEFWIKQTLHFLRQELHTGYYENRELNLLTGLTGVGLTLLSYYAEEDLSWSRWLLL